MLGLLILICSLGGVHAEEEIIDKSITQINNENFKNVTGVSRPFEKSTEALQREWFVIFYSPTCIHCKRAMPFWNEFARSIKEDKSGKFDWLKIGAVNCKSYKEFCNEMGVMSYPTFLFLSKNHKAIAHKGNRTKQDWTKFAMEKHKEQQSSLKAGDNKQQKPEKKKDSEAQNRTTKTAGTKPQKVDQTTKKTNEPPTVKPSITSESNKSNTSSTDKSNSSQKKQKSATSKQQSGDNETVFTKVFYFLRRLTAYQIVELAIIIGITVGLLYLSLCADDGMEFKRLGQRGEDMRMIGLPEWS